MKVSSFLLWSGGENALPSFIRWLLLRCLSNSEAQEVLKEARDMICGAHHPCPKLKNRLYRLGYYWPMMIADAMEYAKLRKACQIHADFIHQPLELHHPTVTLWPFKAWGIDVIGPISPPSGRGHRFILTITDYFSKWVKAVQLTEVKTTNIINFIKHYHIHQLDVLRRFIHDNDPQFASQIFYRFGDKYQNQNVTSTAYNPVADGLAEAFNKTIIKIVKKFGSTSKWDWNKKLSDCL